MPEVSPRRWTVQIDDGPPTPCPPGTSVLRALAAGGRRGVPIGCRSGGCGVCRVRVESGHYERGPMSADEVPPADAAVGIALACRINPLSDLRITVLGRRPRSTPGALPPVKTHACEEIRS